jgi:hypothetical protein
MGTGRFYYFIKSLSDAAQPRGNGERIRVHYVSYVLHALLLKIKHGDKCQIIGRQKLQRFFQGLYGILVLLPEELVQRLVGHAFHILITVVYGNDWQTAATQVVQRLMAGNATQPSNQWSSMLIIGADAAERFDKHILIHFFGILPTTHDACHLGKNQVAIGLEHTLLGFPFLTAQAPYEFMCFVVHAFYDCSLFKYTRDFTKYNALVELFCRKRRKKLFDASKTAFLLLKRTKRDNRKSAQKSTRREKEKRKKKVCKSLEKLPLKSTAILGAFSTPKVVRVSPMER